MESQWEAVDPDTAKRYLKANQNNRTIYANVVKRYAHDMSTGQWEQSHQGIGFDDKGVLLDGQHRLLGIVESGATVNLLVTRGLPTSVQRNMDRGRVRKVSDFLEGKNATVRVSTIRILLGLRAVRDYDYGFTPVAIDASYRGISDGDVYDFIDTEQELMDELAEVVPLACSAATHAPGGTGGAALAVAAVTFPHVGQNVLRQLRTGAALEVGDPVLAFRNYSYRIRPQVRHHVALRLFLGIQQGARMRKFQVEGVHAPLRIAQFIR